MYKDLIKSLAPQSTKWTNWAGNVSCYANGVFYPRTEAEIQTIVLDAAKEGKKIRVVGSGHSFSQLIETNQYIISLVYLSGIIDIDKEKKQAQIWAGTSIKIANQKLYEEGLAMINLGDIDVQTLAGATATGTHGTGTAFGNISTEIVHFRIILANGEILECSKDQNKDLFEAGRVSLGALGIITQITLNVAEAYKLEFVSKANSFENTLENLQKYNAENRNFEFYYFPFSETLQLKVSNKTEKPVKHNKVLAHINDVFMENTVMQMVCKLGTKMPSLYKKISQGMAKAFPKGTTINYSHEVYATVRNVRFKEMEYNIPMEHFKTVLNRMKALIEEKSYYVFFPVECRFVKGDDIWLSPAYGRDSAYIAIHVFHETPHNPYFEEIEALFMEYDGRPHWGKMHTRTAETLAQTYPKWKDFLALRQKHDPHNLFLNPHLEGVFGEV